MCIHVFALEAAPPHTSVFDLLSPFPQALNPDNDPDFDEEAELSIVLCRDDYIHGLNKQWRGKDAPTDVLSFPQEEENGVLGDLVISIDTAQRQVCERIHFVLLRDPPHVLLTRFPQSRKEVGDARPVGPRRRRRKQHYKGGREGQTVETIAG